MKFIDYKDLNLNEFTITTKVGTTSTDKSVFALESANQTIYGAFNEAKVVKLTGENLSHFPPSTFVWFCDTNFFKERKPNVFNISGVRDKIQVYSKVNKELQEIFYKCSSGLTVKSEEFGSSHYISAFREFFFDYLELRGYDAANWAVAVKLSKKLYNQEVLTDNGLSFLKDMTLVYQEFYRYIAYPILNKMAVPYISRFEIKGETMVLNEDILPLLTKAILDSLISYKSKELLKYAEIHVKYREDFQRLAKLLGEDITTDKLNQLIKECRVKTFFDSLKNLYVDYYYYLCD